MKKLLTTIAIFASISLNAQSDSLKIDSLKKELIRKKEALKTLKGYEKVIREQKKMNDLIIQNQKYDSLIICQHEKINTYYFKKNEKR